MGPGLHPPAPRGSKRGQTGRNVNRSLLSEQRREFTVLMMRMMMVKTNTSMALIEFTELVHGQAQGRREDPSLARCRPSQERRHAERR